MAPFDTPYATFYWSAIVNIVLSCTIFQLYDEPRGGANSRPRGVRPPFWENRDLEIWLRGHSMLLKLVPFKRLGGFHIPVYSNYSRTCSRL